VEGLCGRDWSGAALAAKGLNEAESAAFRRAVKEHLVALACEGSTAPSGEVTLCFTDIQGSTRLWECFGARFKPVLDLHHKLMRSAILKHWGYEVRVGAVAHIVRGRGGGKRDVGVELN